MRRVVAQSGRQSRRLAPLRLAGLGTRPDGMVGKSYHAARARAVRLMRGDAHGNLGVCWSLKEIHTCYFRGRDRIRRLSDASLHSEGEGG